MIFERYRSRPQQPSIPLVFSVVFYEFLTLDCGVRLHTHVGGNGGKSGPLLVWLRWSWQPDRQLCSALGNARLRGPCCSELRRDRNFGLVLPISELRAG